MKKTFKLAIAASVLTAPALADSPYIANSLRNMENPLYLPSAGELYSKIGFGVMYKVTDSNDAQKKLFHDGEKEFPIWRPSLDLGYGITDRWTVHGQIGYTHNHDADRYGFHLGRIGTTYRILSEDFIWDVYGDFHMGGISKMKGSLITKTGNPADLTFKYDNFSNGRWGYHVGTKVGKVWDRWTTSAFVELLRTWGNHNNEIDVSKVAPGLETLYSLTPGSIPNKLSVDLKSTTEYDLGANAFYQVNDRWSFGLSLKYIYHAENGLKKIHTKVSNPDAKAVLGGLITNYKHMHDEFSEFAQAFTVAYQASDSMQVAWFIENTIDDGQHLSASTTDFKAETGVRLNVKF
ncbi:MAG: hypothetical protein J5679_03210 [Alphaproteobacteria bacterium]|nr:hypothetical protein [Alphaproteobacteria bacterium]